MAHTCPECGQLCHCGFDVDDIDFGEDPLCDHCFEDEEEYDDQDYDDEDGDIDHLHDSDYL